jgi:hypothetical protein
MPIWLIGSAVAAAAPAPTWTDKAQAIAAGFAAVGVVAGLFFSGYQIRKGRLEQTAQRALSLMQLLMDVTGVMVDRPHLAAYIYDRRDLPAQGEDSHDEVLAYGRLFMSFGEVVGWQIRAHQMEEDAAKAWRDYFTDLYRTSPTVKAAVDENPTLLAEETLDLFGVDPALRRRG